MTTDKHDLRRRLRKRVAGMSEEGRRRESDLLCERLIQDEVLSGCRVIGVYLALRDEPDLRFALQTFLDRGQQLALPFLETDGNWIFRSIESLDGPASGPWGLPLPKPGPILDPDIIDLVLVPGQGFTKQGDRIGRGKGIYDRLLADISAHTIGIAFPCQIVRELPRESHDVRLDDVWHGSQTGD